MMFTKFATHPNAQAFIVNRENGDKELFSYKTCACGVYNGWLVVYGLYSATTRKHIGWFMRELGLSYQTAKILHKNGITMNIHTGEIQPIQ